MADEKKKKKSKTKGQYQVQFWSCVIAITILGAIGLKYVYDNNLVQGITNLLNSLPPNVNPLLAYGAISAVVGFSFAFVAIKQPKKSVEEELGGMDKMGSSHWMTNEEIEKTFPKLAYDDIHNHNVNGFVVQTVDIKGRTYAHYKEKTHCLAIGTTGSGKTSRLINPTLQFIGRSKTHPSVVMSDPKGEIWHDNSKFFKQNGYKLICINLRDVVEKSDCWNPCYTAWKYWQEAVHQKDKVKRVTNLDLKKLKQKYKLATDEREYKNECYVYKDKAFATIEDVQIEVKRQESTLKGKAIDEINDIVYTLFPEKDPKDSYWQKSSANVVAGILIGMLEDSENPELGVTERTFNLSSVASNLTLNASSIMEYFDIRDLSSAARARARGTLSAGGETKGTITSTIQSGLYPFTEPDIQYCTCRNDIDLSEIGKRPCAVFLIVPDEKENRHVFASLFITQLYKALIDVASHTEKNCLPHPVNFILDEFANIPKIPGMDNKITVSRSRGIFFLLIIQGLNQLEEKYGKVGDTIRDNCNLLIYVATNDFNTAKYFSDLCGNTTSVQKSKTESKGKDKSKSSNISLASEPLIRPEELLRIPEGTTIVKMLRCQPAKLHQIKWWQAKENINGPVDETKKWDRDVFTFETQGFYNIETAIKYAEEKSREERRKKLEEKKKAEAKPMDNKPSGSIFSSPKIDEPKQQESIASPFAKTSNSTKITPPSTSEELDADEELDAIKAFLESLEANIGDEAPVEKPKIVHQPTPTISSPTISSPKVEPSAPAEEKQPISGFDISKIFKDD